MRVVWANPTFVVLLRACHAEPASNTQLGIGHLGYEPADVDAAIFAASPSTHGMLLFPSEHPVH
jgi:hypothetical protein